MKATGVGFSTKNREKKKMAKKLIITDSDISLVLFNPFFVPFLSPVSPFVMDIFSSCVF